MASLDLKELTPIAAKLKEENKKIVLTNGCFDILHVGHVRYLQAARQLGDVLIVGINSDESVKALKGEGRPIVSQKERLELVASLGCVDYAVIFSDLNPENLIKLVRPDIHVKGGDYSLNDIPEARLVQSLGGREIVLDKVEGRSTSNLIRKILDSYPRWDNTGNGSSEAPSDDRAHLSVEQRIIAELEDSISVKQQLARLLTRKIARAAEIIIEAYSEGRKLLLIGNGGSTDDAQHIAAEFIGRFKMTRRGLPAIPLTTPCVLTALANDFGFDSVFARQIEALAEEGDVLIAISTSGKSPNVLKGVEMARLKNVKTIAFTGGDGGELKNMADLAIIVPSSNTPRIQEAHIMIGHIICGLVEENLPEPGKPQGSKARGNTGNRRVLLPLYR